MSRPKPRTTRPPEYFSVLLKLVLEGIRAGWMSISCQYAPSRLQASNSVL